jgi:large subunit ribosomal protein L15
MAKGLVKDLKEGVKILGEGELTKPLIVRAHKFSRAAKEKIEAAGGRAEEV